MTAFQSDCSSVGLGVPGDTIMGGIVAVNWASKTTKEKVDTLKAFSMPWHMRV